MMPRLRAVLFASAIAVPAAASAFVPPVKSPPHGGEKRIDFELDTVDVEVQRPLVGLFEVSTTRTRHSLIRIRTDFVKEVVRSAEDI